MSEPPVDLPRVRRALAELDRIERDHPEAFDDNRLPATEAELVEAMARQKSDDPMKPVTLRMPESMIERVKDMQARLQAERPETTVTQGDAIRHLVLKGLSTQP